MIIKCIINNNAIINNNLWKNPRSYFITEVKSVYSAVRTGSLNKAVCASSLLAFSCLSILPKFRKSTISFVMSVRLSVRLSVLLSVRMEQLGLQWMDFHEILWQILGSCDRAS